ncbi:MAG TPA: division/cell wall cluster transcriptional repressor MraZ [Flavobacteriales bacterium]|nr:division/cell wall cluster transcriptional repressor MraZ [Flavobacteriales bacterium]HIA12812.1 division/cell wall cluster transcriptional repressor MraZ [Flavobacteriales bacterium]
MSNFLGVYECKVDSKGRLMLPSGLKKQLTPLLNEGFILKRSVFHPCLELYPMSEWNNIIGEVNKLNRFVKENIDFIRMFTTGLKVIQLDATGRLLIPKDLIEFTGIVKNIVVSSAINMIELWDKDKYEKVINDPNVDFAELAERVMGNKDKDS